MNMDEADPPNQSDRRDFLPKSEKVDESSADVSTVSPMDNPEMDVHGEATRPGLAKTKENNAQNAPPPTIRLLTRPQLRRETSAPPPPQQPPPPAPPQQQQDEVGTDSLSLMQLKRLVTDMPKVEPTAYAFEYKDTQSFPEELEEWFQYTEEDKSMVLQGKTTFEAKWDDFLHATAGTSGDALTWVQASEDRRKLFVLGQILGLGNDDIFDRVACLEALLYIALGSWGDTAGLKDDDDPAKDAEEKGDDSCHDYDSSSLQIRWMRKGAETILFCSGLQRIYDAFTRICEQEQSVGSRLAE